MPPLCTTLLRTLTDGGVHRVNALIISEGSGHSRLKDVGATDVVVDDDDDLALMDDLTVGGRLAGRWFAGNIFARCCVDFILVEA